MTTFQLKKIKEDSDDVPKYEYFNVPDEDEILESHGLILFIYFIVFHFNVSFYISKLFTKHDYFSFSQVHSHSQMELKLIKHPSRIIITTEVY